MNDKQLAAVLAANPRVRVRVNDRTGKMKIIAREESIPDEPEHCPVCGEQYERRALHATSDRDADRPGEGYALFHHGERSGFFAAGCRVDDYWTSRQTVITTYERAQRVSREHSPEVRE